MLNPLGLINDGYMDLVFYPGTITAFFALYMFILPGGRMSYDPGFRCYRCKSAKIVNKQKGADGEYVTQDINIDGEDLTFNKFAKYTVLPNSLDLIVDLKTIFNNVYNRPEFNS